MICHCEVKDGKIHLGEHRERFYEFLAPLEGKSVELSIERIRVKRTNHQNRYYWAVVLKTFGDHLGYHPEELHEALKLRFLPRDPESAIVVARSTTELNTKEFSEYVDRIIQLAAEMGCYIPVAGQI